MTEYRRTDLNKKPNVGYGSEVPPHLDDVKIIFDQQELREKDAIRFFDHFQKRSWQTKTWVPIKNWKQVADNDVSLPDSKIKKYNEMEEIRDCSHVAALSLTDFTDLFEKAGYKYMNSNFYSMRIGLEEQLEASFPSDSDTLKNMIVADVGVNDLEINVTKTNDGYNLHYPIHIFSANN